MKKTFHYIILYPASLIYGGITYIRNLFFNKQIYKSTRFDIPVISVGNLTVGGTGKTPHTEYIISLLQDKYKIAVLSRGYKRQTKGFYVADKNSNAAEIGDEPYQIYRKFHDIIVAVDEKRVHGISQLLLSYPDIEVIILDDAFQHRKVTPGFSILLTDYNRLFTRDFYLPSGRLREPKNGARRADILVVTKCPESISETEMNNIKQELSQVHDTPTFFSAYEYSDLKPVFNNSNKDVLKNKPAILTVTGIVSPKPMIEYLKGFSSYVDHLSFQDHHNFSAKDIECIYKKFNMMNFEHKILVVTEKDASRLLHNKFYPEELKPITFSLPIQVKILNDQTDLFTHKIQEYVTKNSRNS